MKTTVMEDLFCTSEDGTRIAYDVTGKGPALVLLNGIGKTRRDWHQLGYVDGLKKNYRVMVNWLNQNPDIHNNKKIKVVTIGGLTHQQEFSQIKKVFPVVSSFLNQQH